MEFVSYIKSIRIKHENYKSMIEYVLKTFCPASECLKNGLETKCIKTEKYKLIRNELDMGRIIENSIVQLHRKFLSS